MAKYCFTMTTETPVRLELTVYEMRKLCRILQREVAGDHAERFLAEDLHAVLVDGIKTAGTTMRVEADYLANHVVEDMADQLASAAQQRDRAKADAVDVSD
jgi:orotate phosphoribosyltransferase-like protein